MHAGAQYFLGSQPVILASFPAFFKQTTHIDNVMIAQGVAALAAVGIIVGCKWAGRLPAELQSARSILFSGWAMAACLLVLPFLIDPWSMSLLILVYGFFGGCYLVSLNTILQLKTIH